MSEENKIKHSRARRKLLTTLSVGGTTTAIANSWVSPVVKKTILPSHAQTSGLCGGLQRVFTRLNTDGCAGNNFNIDFTEDAPQSAIAFQNVPCAVQLGGDTGNFDVGRGDFTFNQTVNQFNVNFNGSLGDAVANFGGPAPSTSISFDIQFENDLDAPVQMNSDVGLTATWSTGDCDGRYDFTWLTPR